MQYVVTPSHFTWNQLSEKDRGGPSDDFINVNQSATFGEIVEHEKKIKRMREQSHDKVSDEDKPFYYFDVKPKKSGSKEKEKI